MSSVDMLTELPMGRGVLTAADVKKLMSSTRLKNVYGPKVLEFHESGEAAINPSEVWPELDGREATSLYQGFLSAIKKADLADAIRVIKREDDVFLINVEAANLVMTQPATDTEDENDTTAVTDEAE